MIPPKRPSFTYKKVDYYAQGITSERWHGQTERIKNRQKKKRFTSIEDYVDTSAQGQKLIIAANNRISLINTDKNNRISQVNMDKITELEHKYRQK